MTDFEFKAIDREGFETLDNITEARRFNRWMYDTIAPYCGRDTLEVGSGIGNLSKHLLDDSHSCTLTDIRRMYVDTLKEKFSSHKHLREIRQLDIADPQIEANHAELIGRFDSIVFLNVLEHIKDETQPIENCRKLLKPGGKVIVLVPAYQFLYNSFDKELHHYRRYTAKSLRQSVGRQFQVEQTFYFNLIGILGWFVSGSLLRKKIVPKNQLKLYDRFVPVFRLIDKLTFRCVGLSVIAIGQKT